MYFNSRDERYKRPFGAAETGENIYFKVDGANAPSLELYADGAAEPTVFKADPHGEFSIKIDRAGLYFYRFALKTGFIERGARGNGLLTDGSGQKFQLTVYDRYTTPDRFKGGVMYQIFPDSFCRSGTPKIGVPSDREYAAVSDPPEYRPDKNGRYSNRYYGGDLAGIIMKLPYLASLGITIIYLNPIFEAHSNHRYNTADYMKIDPLLGTLEDFRCLAATALSLGIRIILDGVFSHTGDDSLYFNRQGRYGEKGAFGNPDSEYYSWYNFNGNRYSAWWNIPTLPEVNESDPDFCKFVCGEGGVIDYWLTNGASGFRLDVADELPDSFIAEIKKAINRHPGCLLIGEVWEDASNKISYDVRRRYLLGSELDSVMNYPFKQAIIAFLLTGDAAAFAESVESIVENYPKPTQDVLMNLLSTHDTARIINALSVPNPPAGKANQQKFIIPRGDYLRGVELLKLAFVLSFTLPGFPCIYYGDEIGMQGFGDPFCRSFYLWGDPPCDLRPLITKLSAIRKKHTAFKDGSCRFISSDGGLVAFERVSGGSRLLIAVNRGDSEAEIKYNGAVYKVGAWRYLITE